MTEFDTIKTMLKRVGDSIIITTWEFLDEALIEDVTVRIAFRFKDGKLESISRDDKDY